MHQAHKAITEWCEKYQCASFQDAEDTNNSYTTLKAALSSALDALQDVTLYNAEGRLFFATRCKDKALQSESVLTARKLFSESKCGATATAMLPFLKRFMDTYQVVDI